MGSVVGVLLGAVLGFSPVAWAESGALPRRVVTLAPSVTEVVYALGAGSSVAGVCGQCDFPAATASVAKVGGYLAPSLEAVVAIRPDLVIAVPSPGNREAVRTLGRLGIEVLVVRDGRLADLWASIRAIGGALGRPERATALIERLRGGLDRVQESVAERPRRRVLLVVGHRPLVVAGAGTLQHELLALAGGDNVAGRIAGRWPVVSEEFVLRAAPDVVLDGSMGSEAGGSAILGGGRPGGPRVVRVSIDELARAGPRVVGAAEAVARHLHPEAAP